MRELRSSRWWIPLSSLFVLALAVAPLTAQERERDRDDWEYEWDEGLHQEEWYDPSDWIDLDESISYERDWFDSTYDYAPYQRADDYGFQEDADDYMYEDDYPHDYYTDDWYEDGNVLDDWWEQ